MGFAAQLSTVVCDSDAKVNFLLDKRPPPLKSIILMKEIPEATKLRGQKLGIAIIPFEEVERIGAAKSHPPVVSLLPSYPSFWIISWQYLHINMFVGSPQNQKTCARSASPQGRQGSRKV